MLLLQDSPDWVWSWAFLPYINLRSMRVLVLERRENFLITAFQDSLICRTYGIFFVIESSNHLEHFLKDVYWCRKL